MSPIILSGAQMHATFDFIVALKYVIATAMLCMIILAPAWIAAQTKKDKFPTGMARTASWLFGWTVIGWLVGLIIASRK